MIYGFLAVAVVFFVFGWAFFKHRAKLEAEATAVAKKELGKL